MEVGQQRVPGVGEDLPGGGHQAAPGAGGEEQDDVDQAVEHPEGGRDPVPGAAQADLGAARQRDDGGEAALVVARGEGPLFHRHLVPGEADPFRAGSAVIVEVEAGVGGDDLDPRADEHAHE